MKKKFFGFFLGLTVSGTAHSVKALPSPSAVFSQKKNPCSEFFFLSVCFLNQKPLLVFGKIDEVISGIDQLLAG